MILFSQKKKEKIYRDREEIQVLLRSVFVVVVNEQMP
jgi:hypothetical protein